MKPQQALAFIQERKAQPTALLMDPSGQRGHAYGARNTPQMFVINQAGMIAYAGAIDTQPTGVSPYSNCLPLASSWAKASADTGLLK